MTDLVTKQHVEILKAAQTPEEAAQVFLGAVSHGLAKVVAEKLDEVLSAATASTKGVNAIDGWNKLVKGGIIDIAWERPALGLPVGQVVAFAPRQTDGLAKFGVEIGVGISIKGSF